MDPLEEQSNTLSRCGSFYYRVLTDATKVEAEYMSHLTFCNRTTAQLKQISNAVLGGCYYNDFYRTFKFTDADISWNGTKAALQRRATLNGNPVPARYERLTIEGAFLGQTDETHVAASSDAKALLFPDADSSITLPATQELTWDLAIDPDVMVTSIEQPNGDILYANIDFGSTFGKLTFLTNPLKLFPNMQLFARSYTGRMPNLYNYMLRLDDVYGPVDRVLYFYRHTQTPKSLYYASAQACGLAVVRQDCTIVSVAPLLDGYAYSTTDGVYDAPYPHSKLAEGTELKKDTVIGGDELYVLCGPHDPLPPSVTSILLDNILPVKGLSAPNADIDIYNSNGLYQPMYEGPAKKLKQYQDFLQAVTDVQVIDSADGLNDTLRDKIEKTGYTVGDSFKLVLKVAELEGGGQRPLLDLIPTQGDKSTYCLNITTGGDKPIIYGLVYKGDGPNLTWVAPDIHTDDYNEWMRDGTTLSSYISRDRTLGIDASSEDLESFNWGVPVTFTIYYDARTNTSGVIVAGNPIDAQRGENRVVLKNVVLNLNDITNGSGNTSGTGGIKKCTMQLSVQKTAAAAIDYPQENAIAHIRNEVCPNRVITACINEGYMARDMYLKLTNFLQRELLVGSVLATANLPVIIQSDAGSIDIPTDFTPVAYLESNGVQYINTRIIPDNLTGQRCDYWSFISTEDQHIAGINQNPSFMLPPIVRAREPNPLTSGYAWGAWVKVVSVTETCRSTSSLNFLNDRKAISASELMSFEEPLAELPFTPTLQIYLFGANKANVHNNKFHGRIYSYQLSQGDKLVLDLVPALDETGAPCMYDKVGKFALYNSGGEDDFIYPTESTTYSLRRVLPEWGKLTGHGLRRLYHTPVGWQGDLSDYARENGFKRIVYTEKPEEGYWTAHWTETSNEIVREWTETDPPLEEELTM